jgi:3-hydroxybutyryl-CoA dehydrogenase
MAPAGAGGGGAVAGAGGRAEVAVIGAGTMGRGIAQVFAAAGHAVRLCDATPAAAEAGRAQVAAALDRLAGRGKLAPGARDEILARLVVAAGPDEAARGAGLVVESVPERADLKGEVLARALAAAPPGALVASNTSSLSVTDLGRRAGAPARVVGMHFFNPPPAMELVEVVRGLETSEASVEAAAAFAAGAGKTPIVVRDVAGFASSRLGVALGAEAIRMVEQGVASVAAIDRAMELGYRHPMGPLKLGDLVGLDVRLAILEHLHRELGETFRPPALLRQMVRAGRLGKKTGLGFYRWTDAGPEPAP